MKRLNDFELSSRIAGMSCEDLEAQLRWMMYVSTDPLHRQQAIQIRFLRTQGYVLCGN